MTPDPTPEASPPRLSLVTPVGAEGSQRIALLVVLSFSCLAALRIAWELWAGLLLGVLVSFAIEPLHGALLSRVGHRHTLAAVLSVTFLALSGVLAFGVLAYLVGSEASVIATAFRSESPLRRLSGEIARVMTDLGLPRALAKAESSRVTERLAQGMSTGLSSLASSSFEWGTGALIGLLTVFESLRSAVSIEIRLARLLPLHPRVTGELVSNFREVGRGTLLGTLFAGVLQGILASIGFALGGLDGAILLGVLTTFASLVPVVGTLLVWVPVSVALLAGGHPVAAAFEFLWGALVTTSLVDYVIRPLVAGRECRGHPLLVLVGMIGGAHAFGPVGLIAGPIVMTFFACAVRIYEREIVRPLQEEALEVTRRATVA